VATKQREIPLTIIIGQLALNQPNRNHKASPIKSNIHAMELFLSSAQVIAHRCKLISRVMTGELPFTHKEFGKMWLEKFFAANESWDVVLKYIKEQEAGTSHLKGIMNVMTPYRQELLLIPID
jgi:hypothetical protein